MDQSAVNITLTGSELLSAATIGVLRQIEGLKKGLTHKYGYHGDGWSIHCEGAAGELAFAKALNLYWGGTVNTFKDADIGANIQIRTRSKHDYDLLVRDGDADDEIFVLVTGQAPSYCVRGWIYGHEGKKDRWRKEYGGRPPAYFVPQNKLRTIVELRRALSTNNA